MNGIEQLSRRRTAGEGSAHHTPYPPLTARGGALAVRRGPDGAGLLVSGAAILLAAAAGVLLAAGLDPEKVDGPGIRSASAGRLALSFPATFRRVEYKGEIPGLRFARPLALAPPYGAPRARIVAGQVPAAGPELLPRAFLEQLETAPTRKETIRLGKTDAFRYSDLRLKDVNSRLTLYAVPNTGGVAAIACSSAGPRDDAFLSDCERVAATLRLSRFRAYPLAVNRRSADTLQRVSHTLGSARASGLIRLSDARTPTGQARAALDLARSFQTAAGALASGQRNRADQRAYAPTLTALRRTRDAYNTMAAAARDGKSSRFAAARRMVRENEALLARELAGVRISARPRTEEVPGEGTTGTRVAGSDSRAPSKGGAGDEDAVPSWVSFVLAALAVLMLAGAGAQAAAARTPFSPADRLDMWVKRRALRRPE